MYKNLARITAILFLVLTLVPAAMAQDQTVDELLDAYYLVLGEALTTGESADWLEFFAEDASVAVPALAPQPVVGLEMIDAAMWPGIFGNVGGSTIENPLREVDGNTATVYAMWMGGTGGDMPIQESFEFNDEGKITSYTVNVGATPPEEEAAEEAPATTTEESATLPASGGAGLIMLPGLLILGGATLVGLGKRLGR